MVKILTIKHKIHHLITTLFIDPTYLHQRMKGSQKVEELKMRPKNDPYSIWWTLTCYWIKRSNTLSLYMKKGKTTSRKQLVSFFHGNFNEKKENDNGRCLSCIVSSNGIIERISVLNTKWRATQNKAARTIWQMKIVIQMWFHETATWWCDKHLCCFLN